MHIERDLRTLGPPWQAAGNHWSTHCTGCTWGIVGIKGACEERPFLLHPAAVIWHHLLLQGAEADREGTPTLRRNPRAMYVSHMPGLLQGPVLGRERMTPVLGLRQRDTVMLTARLTPCQVKPRPRWARGSGSPPSALERTDLMSNISPFDKSRATGHRAEDVTAGNDEE